MTDDQACGQPQEKGMEPFANTGAALGKRRPRIAWTAADDFELKHIYSLRHAGRRAAGIRKLAAVKGCNPSHCRKRACRKGLAHRTLNSKPLPEKPTGPTYSRTELADYLGISKETLNNLLERFPIRKLRYHHPAKFGEDEVQLWLWANLERLDLRKMDQNWLVRMLKEAA